MTNNETKPVWVFNPETGVLVGTSCGCQRCRATRARAAAAQLARLAVPSKRRQGLWERLKARLMKGN